MNRKVASTSILGGHGRPCRKLKLITPIHLLSLLSILKQMDVKEYQLIGLTYGFDKII
jgi:hypothetical protein